jgi:hypothetical protein
MNRHWYCAITLSTIHLSNWWIFLDSEEGTLLHSHVQIKRYDLVIPFRVSPLNGAFEKSNDVQNDVSMLQYVSLGNWWRRMLRERSHPCANIISFCYSHYCVDIVWVYHSENYNFCSFLHRGLVTFKELRFCSVVSYVILSE